MEELCRKNFGVEEKWLKFDLSAKLSKVLSGKYFYFKEKAGPMFFDRSADGLRLPPGCI